MVHGYHVILPHYGFWLPNDPRESWSDFVYRWELARFGRSTRHLDQRTLADLTDEEMVRRDAARAALKYPAVTLMGLQEVSVAKGFGAKAARSGYSIWACSILPEHTHLVIARHTYKVEQMANLLKGAATRQLVTCLPCGIGLNISGRRLGEIIEGTANIRWTDAAPLRGRALNRHPNHKRRNRRIRDLGRSATAGHRTGVETK